MKQLRAAADYRDINCGTEILTVALIAMQAW
jgi:hypothetical protein